MKKYKLSFTMNEKKFKKLLEALGPVNQILNSIERQETEQRRMMEGPQAERARKAIHDSIRRETEEELIKYGGEMLMEYLPTMLAGRFDEDLPKAHADKMLNRIRNNEKGEWK